MSAIPLAGHLADGVHVGHLAVEMHDDRRRGARSDRGLDVGRGDEERGVVDVDEHRSGADFDDGFDRRDERVGRAR